MIDKLSYFISTDTIPEKNLSVEEYLLDTVRPGEMILYLWQNERTVVIGKNQNAWKECRFQELESDGGHLARRLSGGGAVFHDLGNLNFTFLVPTEDYDLEKQMSVLLKAVQSLGIPAEKSGRNDVTCEGKKFSGNAFCQKGPNSYHHGTIMLRVDTQKVERYLNVSEKKLRSKGVKSVSSRVCNLCDFRPDLTVEMMEEKLLAALAETYGLAPVQIFEKDFDQEQIAKMQEHNSSWEWKFGRKLAFSWEAGERFNWGEVQLQLKVDEGKIQDAVLYSDALDAPFIEWLSSRLTGCRFDADAVIESLSDPKMNDLQKQILTDVAGLLRQKA